MKWRFIFTLISGTLGAFKQLGSRQASSTLNSILITRDTNLNEVIFPVAMTRKNSPFKRRCKSYYAIKDNQDLRQTFFKTDSQTDIEMIQKVYWDIEQACDPSKSHSYVFKCGGSKCRDRWKAYTFPHDDTVYICPYFFEKDADERGHVLIHELSHIND
ncbi:hypothetical protein MCOR25_011126, partial [Pyricularia grisea]